MVFSSVFLDLFILFAQKVRFRLRQSIKCMQICLLWINMLHLHTFLWMRRFRNCKLCFKKKRVSKHSGEGLWGSERQLRMCKKQNWTRGQERSPASLVDCFQADYYTTTQAQKYTEIKTVVISRNPISGTTASFSLVMSKWKTFLSVMHRWHFTYRAILNPGLLRRKSYWV